MDKGFYWIKFNGRWEPSEYMGDEYFHRLGSRHEWSEKDISFEKIGKKISSNQFK